MTRVLSPTSSYEVALPDDIRENYDESVASFWKDESPVLLQISTRKRTEQSQVGAEDRLRERIHGSGGTWMDVHFLPSFFEDVAAAKTTDEKGTTWLHVYMTNSQLAIYATISGPAQAMGGEADWALSALQTIKTREYDHPIS
jgi:hypothetical protein